MVRKKGKVGSTRIGIAVYHCVFSTYQRKAVFFDEIQSTADALIREIATDKGYELIAYAVMPDHIHLLLCLAFGEVPQAMNMFKGIVSRRIFQKFPDLRMDMRSHHLWNTGYYARTVDAPSITAIIRYIHDQEHPPHDV